MKKVRLEKAGKALPGALRWQLAVVSVGIEVVSVKASKEDTGESGTMLSGSVREKKQHARVRKKKSKEAETASKRDMEDRIAVEH